MKVYGHLRDEHSVNMAQKVTFSKPQLEKVVPMPEQTPASSKRVISTGHGSIYATTTNGLLWSRRFLIMPGKSKSSEIKHAAPNHPKKMPLICSRQYPW